MFKEQLETVIDELKYFNYSNPQKHIQRFVKSLSNGKILLFDKDDNEIWHRSDSNLLNEYNMEVFIGALISYKFENYDEGLNYMRDLLIEKNLQYGNAILEPMKVFSSKVSNEDVILSRMDEKLARIVNSNDTTEDAWLDLIGYSIFYLINKIFY